MNLPELDRARVARDRRLAQQPIELPALLELQGNTVRLTLSSDGTGFYTLIQVTVPGGELDGVSQRTLNQPFTRQGDPRKFLLVPQGSFINGVVPIGSTIQVAARGISSETRRELADTPLTTILDVEQKQLLEALVASQSDLRPALIALYEELEMSMGDSLTYVRKGVELHKQAIQNAVDIVQSKRISFLETGKDPYWQGIIGMIAIVFFVELAAGVVGAAFVGMLLRGLARFSPTTAASLAGGMVRVKAPTLQNVNKLMARLKQNKDGLRLLKQQRRDRSGPMFVTPGYLSEPARMATAVNIVNGKISELKSQRRALIDALKKDRSALKKQAVDSVQASDFLREKAAALSDEAKLAAKAGKEVAGGFVSKTKGRKFQADSALIPLDVSMKLHVQTIWDEELWNVEQIYQDIRAIRREIPFIGEDQGETQLSLALSVLPTVLDLEVFAETLRIYLEENALGLLNDLLASDYELRLWVMLYGGEVAHYKALELRFPIQPRYPGDKVMRTVFPVTIEQDKKDLELADPDNRNMLSALNLLPREAAAVRSWRNISRTEFEQLRNTHVVHVEHVGRKEFFEYIRKRFFPEKTYNEIAEVLADMYQALRKAIDTSHRRLSRDVTAGIRWVITQSATDQVTPAQNEASEQIRNQGGNQTDR